MDDMGRVGGLGHGVVWLCMVHLISHSTAQLFEYAVQPALHILCTLTCTSVISQHRPIFPQRKRSFACCIFGVHPASSSSLSATQPTNLTIMNTEYMTITPTTSLLIEACTNLGYLYVDSVLYLHAPSQQARLSSLRLSPSTSDQSNSPSLCLFIFRIPIS